MLNTKETELARLFQDARLLLPDSVSARYARLHSAGQQQKHFYRRDVTLTTQDGISASDIVHQTNPYGPIISTAANPTAYGSWGVHSGELTWGSSVDWANNGDVVFTGNAGWWIGMSVESYNGIFGDCMADPLSVFSETAFGGTAYSNTPICWVGATEEPGLFGCEGAEYFDRWAKGWSTLECAWTGLTATNGYVDRSFGAVVTDVLLVA